MSCVVLGGVAAGCGSDSSSGGNATASDQTAKSGGSAANADAVRIVKAAETTAAYGPAAKGLTADQLTAATPAAVGKDVVPYKPQGGAKKKVILISCASISPTCTRQTTV